VVGTSTGSPVAQQAESSESYMGRTCSRAISASRSHAGDEVPTEVATRRAPTCIHACSRLLPPVQALGHPPLSTSHSKG
jgi:hypothetical protein